MSFDTPFSARHLGLSDIEKSEMLSTIGYQDLNSLIADTIPSGIRKKAPLNLADALSEDEALAALKKIASKNQLFSNFIGQGYYGTHTPKVILRNILENPGWYTAYTPYQAEISQGRMEMLLNYQQMICDMTGMPLANASLLDEGTAAAEAMAMAKRQQRKNKSNCFFIDQGIHPQTLAVVKTRASYFGYDIIIGDPAAGLPDCFGVLLQYPASNGDISDLKPLIESAHNKDALAIVAADILALSLLKAPGDMGADICLGSTQRFGVPMGFGGPHAAYFAFRDALKRSAPGRIIGVSVDSQGNPALRMAMQTREQHIRREKATSNICTSQVLLAVIAGAYAVYHGPTGIRNIAQGIHGYANQLANSFKIAGYILENDHWFDTLTIATKEKTETLYQACLDHKINVRRNQDSLGISVDETTTIDQLTALAKVFGLSLTANTDTSVVGIPESLARQTDFLTHPVFNSYHTETEMLRYLHRLENKDLALNQSMIPLGSCTMKLNATSEMIPVTWPEFGNLHPFVPMEQAQGYAELFTELEAMLCACTGYDAMSLQPNAGSQGEYAGLLAIMGYHKSRGDAHRTICLIPESAHGTNPASAQMAGMKVVVVACDKDGNVDMDDLQAKATKHADSLAAIMITYPSTHGVFETAVRDICDCVHQHGGQVYIDGANLNALVGLAEPGEFGGDVSHLNLHKTFCIPHGGGGPGMGPIGVNEHLRPFLPGHPEQPLTDNNDAPVISAAPWGSASILPISWMYIRMMGAEGTRRSSEYAILSANYIAKRLEQAYPVLYRGENGCVAHESIIDIRPLKDSSGISEEDIAKRLMDYGFHAPTMSFPVPGTLMIEPTESESKAELDRFCDAMLAIRDEIQKVENEEWPLDNNPLSNAPHTLNDVLNEQWAHPYTREQATRPLSYLKNHKYWPTVNRVDNVHGDRHLICTCPSIDDFR